MDKSDSSHLAPPAISIQQGDWDAYRHHIESTAAQAALPASSGTVDEAEEVAVQIHSASTHAAGDSAGAPLQTEEDILAYRRQCARAYIGMNGRLGGRSYHANEPVILTSDAVAELAELNRLLREERAQKKKR